MKIGLIDVDGHNFPNLALMKFSAKHREIGDTVEMYEPLFGGWYDRVYMSKVFSFSEDYSFPINADDLVKGGTGYQIDIVDGKEVFLQEKNYSVPLDYDTITPDYDLYGIKDTAYGFLTRGCPRNCGFCIVSQKEGCTSVPVANLRDFWSGQKEIKILDPNLLSCCDRQYMIKCLTNLAESGASVDFTQGLDVRLVDDEIIDLLKKIRTTMIHFAWDNPKQDLRSQLKKAADGLGYGRTKITVYVLTNYNSTIAEDLERIYFLRSLDIQPYVMIYQKDTAPPKLRKLQRWVNAPRIFWSVDKFDDYQQEEEE